MSFGRLLFSMRATRAPNIGCGEPSNVARVANAASAFVQFVIRIPSFALLVFIQIYQRTLSPALPVFFGFACGCRFSPSCSHYAADAIRTHGAIVGVFLAAIRLVKCTPLHPGGFDPVPPRHSKPRCTRFAARLPESSTRLS